MNIEALKQAAENATPGPWFVVEHPSNSWTVQTKPTGGGLCIAQKYADAGIEVADFIAAANPAAVLELIASHERLAAALQKVIDMNVQYCIDKYGDASRAESMGCVKVARDAMPAMTD